jgi:hypothetical protein
MKKRHSSESGQALILLVLGVVVLFGFAALAVDGGMTYSDRRHAQMGSDAASLAGGGAAALYMENHGVVYGNFTCGSTAVINAQNSNDPNNPGAKLAAINRAADNDYTLDMDITDNHGVTTVCGIDDHGGWQDKYIDIKTMVTKDSETTFAHFVFKGLIRNTVQAITRVRPRSPAAYGHAIVALNSANCSGNQNGAGFSGNVNTYVNGGGIFSNGCLQVNGGSGSIAVTNGTVNYGGQVQNPGMFSPAPQPTDPLPAGSYDIPAPDCSHASAWNGTGNQLEALSPLSAGLYCVTGNLRLNGNGTFAGQDITIVMLDGDVNINGTVTVQIDAPPRDPDPTPALPGVLIYVPPSNTNPITLNGTSDSYFEGTVYAPASTIEFSGTGGIAAYHSQFIGLNVKASGTADINVVFSEPEQFSKPAMLELYK